MTENFIQRIKIDNLLLLLHTVMTEPYIMRVYFTGSPYLDNQ